IGEGGVASEQLRSAGGSPLGDAWAQRAGQNRIALRIPVRGPARIVDRRTDRQTGVPAIYAGDLPAADQRIPCAAHPAPEHPPASKRKLEYSIDVDHVAHIEAGVGVEVTLPDRVQDERSVVVAYYRLQAGGVVQRVGERIVEVPLQAIVKALAHRKSHPVVVGIGDRAPGREGSILRLEEQGVLAVSEAGQVQIGLYVGPIIPVEVAGYPEDRLGRREARGNVGTIIVGHDIAEVRRKDAFKIR